VDHPLDGIRIKLAWGDKHVDAYERREDEQLGRLKPPYVGASIEINEEDTCIASISHVPKLTSDLGLIVGDAIHSYRSALDQLIFELAYMDTNGQELGTTGFPASDSRSNFEGNYVQTRLLAGLTQKHRAALKRFQPYRGWHEPERTHPIRMLDDLSNDDKHRVTQPAFTAMQNFQMWINPVKNCTFPAGGPDVTFNPLFLGVPLEPHTEICHAPIIVTGPKPEVEMKLRLETFIGFRNGESCRETLRGVGAYARRIVEFFAAEFDRPKALRQRGRPRFGRIRSRIDPVGAAYRARPVSPGQEPSFTIRID
jgi:hypothetical protein